MRVERVAPVLALAYLVLALHGLGSADIVGDDEARESGIVQEIVRGDVLLPRFNGELLPDKPVLYHWLAAVPVALAGFSETAVRLPSAVAGAALIWWTARFGAELLGPWIGVAAAALLATMPALFSRARVARPDVLLVLLLALALGSAFRWWRHGRPRDATVALAALGAATLAKGPVAPALFAITLVAFLAWEGNLRRLPRLFTAPGVIAFLVLGLGWYAIALAGWGDLFVREHLLGRYVRNVLGGLPQGEAYSPRSSAFHLFFYVKHLPAIALPWTPLAALALWQAWRTRGFRDPRLRFLVCWMLAPVVAFTPAEWKLRYYLLPSLPAIALLAAPAAVALLRLRPRPLDRRAIGALAVAGSLVLAVGLIVAPTDVIELSPSDRSTVGVLADVVPGGARGAFVGLGFVAGMAAVAIACRAWAALVGVTVAAVVAWMTLGQPALERATSARDSLRTFAGLVAARWPPPAPLVFHPSAIRPIVVYAGRHVPTTTRRRDLSPGTAVIAPEETYRALVAAGKAGPPLVTATGRAGNLQRQLVVAAEIGP